MRLIPEGIDDDDPEKAAIKTLFNHRLSASSELARHEWLEIVEARHHLWYSISSAKQELIRSFLIYLNLEIVKRARPSSVFDFQYASVGNLFLTGARLFSGSFESAIYLLSAITGVPEKVAVIPAINSNFSHHICAGLIDGSNIYGQNAISHPIATVTLNEDAADALSHSQFLSQEIHEHDGIEDANLPGSLPTLRKQNIDFSKTDVLDLPSRISRIWYINPYGQEIRPPTNPRVHSAIALADCVIYSIGSLYTSIIPCLILREIGVDIAAPSVRFKILILNGSLDRETGPRDDPFDASDFVEAIRNACGGGKPSDYVTHVIHLEGENTPSVDKEALKNMDIESVRIYGRKGDDGMIYDGGALTQALEAILGRRDPQAERNRRNTLQG